jgi:hypothetical protein
VEKEVTIKLPLAVAQGLHLKSKAAMALCVRIRDGRRFLDLYPDSTLCAWIEEKVKKAEKAVIRLSGDITNELLKQGVLRHVNFDS